MTLQKLTVDIRSITKYMTEVLRSEFAKFNPFSLYDYETYMYFLNLCRKMAIVKRFIGNINLDERWILTSDISLRSADLYEF